MNLPELIKHRRTTMGLSYRELSEKTGVSHTYIRDVENGKYVPSFENAAKLSQILELDMKDVIVQTYQSQLRQTLLELIETCHKHEVTIPYAEWVKSNLPLQPLNEDRTKIHDTAFEIASSLYEENRNHVMPDKLNAIKALAKGHHDKLIYETLPDIIAQLTVTMKTQGIHTTRKEINSFLTNLEMKNRTQLSGKAEDDND